jgi:hypothetical protein
LGADQVAAIRPIIAELEAAGLEQPGGGPARYCGAFSVANRGEPWVEVYLEQETIVNLWYPFQEDPLAYLVTLEVEPLPGARVADINRPSCVLAFERAPSRVVARFIDALFTKMYSCGGDYPIDVAVRRFGDTAG